MAASIPACSTRRIWRTRHLDPKSHWRVCRSVTCIAAVIAVLMIWPSSDDTSVRMPKDSYDLDYESILYGIMPSGVQQPPTRPTAQEWLDICRNASAEYWTDDVQAAVPIDIESNHVYGALKPKATRGWGNALSPYWQGRALAHVTGMKFHAVGGVSDASTRKRDHFSWMAYLPTDIPMHESWDINRVKRLCAECGSWKYAAGCRDSWSLIREQIQHDTRAALLTWMQDRELTAPVELAPNDVVIYDRCSNETLLIHRYYGPYGYSLYDEFAKQYVAHQRKEPLPFHIRVVGAASAHPPCIVLRRKLREHLASLFKSQELNDMQAVRIDMPDDVRGAALWQDAYKLVFAPHLVIGWKSSFGMWLALANTGNVWMGPLNGCNHHALPPYEPKPPLAPGTLRKRGLRSCREFTGRFGADFHLVDSGAMYGPNIQRLIDKNDTDAMLAWLRSH